MESLREAMPVEVEVYSRAQGIWNEVELASSLARQAFPLAESIRCYLDDDPEEDGRWVVIEVAERESKDSLATYKQCVASWAQQLSAYALGLIRLSYSVREP